MIRIHNFAHGARGLRLIWQCEEMALPYEVVTVSYPPSAAYLALHPLGNVPFLEDDGGVAIHESVAMMLYLAQRHGPTPLLPDKDDPALARVLQMTVFSEATLGAGLNTLMTARFGAPEADKRNWSVRMQESGVERALGYVADRLGDHPFLAGDRFTLADIAICTAFGMWRGALNGALSDKLTTYRDRLAARPAYVRAQAAAAGTQPEATERR